MPSWTNRVAAYPYITLCSFFFLHGENVRLAGEGAPRLQSSRATSMLMSGIFDEVEGDSENELL